MWFEQAIQQQVVELAIEADAPPVTFEPEVVPHHEPTVAPVALKNYIPVGGSCVGPKAPPI
jgi:hypothetical protein